MIFMFVKSTSQFVDTFEDAADAAAYLGVHPYKVQNILDGTAVSVKGYGFIYKPKEDDTTLSFFTRNDQRKEFLELSGGSITWSSCKFMMYGQKDIVLKKSLTLTKQQWVWR